MAPSKRRHSHQIDIFEFSVTVYLSSILYVVFSLLNILCSVKEINIYIYFHIHVIRLLLLLHFNGTMSMEYTCFSACLDTL